MGDVQPLVELLAEYVVFVGHTGAGCLAPASTVTASRPRARALLRAGAIAVGAASIPTTGGRAPPGTACFHPYRSLHPECGRGNVCKVIHRSGHPKFKGPALSTLVNVDPWENRGKVGNSRGH
jgi:hypothetical protein